MAVIPKKFSPPSGDLGARVKALEEYIKYLEERIEFFAATTAKSTQNEKNK